MENYENYQRNEKEKTLSRLYQTLTASNYSIVAFAGYGFINYGTVLFLLTVAAVFYFFYLLKTFISLKKYGWLVSLVVLVAIPYIVKFLFFKDNIALAIVLPNLSLLFFYLFCWILKFAVSNWLEDVRYENLDFEED